MSFKKALPFKKAVAFAGAASMLLGVSSLSAYEQDWTDTKLSSEENNSWFKVGGELWASYEAKDKKSDKSVDYSGFTVGRALLSISGSGKKGAAEDWGYRIAYDAIITPANVQTLNNVIGSNSAAAPYLNLAYFQVPVIKGTKIRVGVQQNPMVDGQAGTSLEGTWGHRFLDADGKAMWEELGIVRSRDAGVGILHTNDMFNLHLLLGNGEGYNRAAGANGQGYGLLVPWTSDPYAANVDASIPADTLAAAQARARNANLAALSTGSAPSMGLSLMGMLSLTPMKASKDSGFDLSINFPFRLENIQGMERREYTDVAGVDYGAQRATYYVGDKKVHKDYQYGVEVDGKLVLSADSSLTLGAGTVKMVDVRANSYALDGSIPNRSIENAMTYGYYYAGTTTSGLAKYVFVTGQFGAIGFVTRFSQGNGTGAGNEQLGVQNKDTSANGLIAMAAPLAGQGPISAQQAADALGYASIKSDRGLAKFQKLTLAVTVKLNDRFRVAVGTHTITNSATNGETYKVTSLDNYQAKLNGNAATGSSASLGKVLMGQPGVDPGLVTAYNNGAVTNKDLYGVKWVDKQVYAKMQFLF